MKKRRTNTKKRKNKKKSFNFKFAFFSLLFFSILGGALYLLYFSPYFQLKNIDVSGAQTLIEKDLLSQFKNASTISMSMLGGEINSESLFIPSKGKTAEILESFPAIDNLQIKKDFFSGNITLEIIEKQPVCIWCYNSKCTLLDKNATYIKDLEGENGFIKIEEYDLYEEGLANWSGITKKEFINILLNIYKNNENIKNFKVYSDKFFANYNYTDLIFDSKQDMDWQIEKMNIVLKKLNQDLKNIEYIDLRFGEQAIVK